MATSNPSTCVAFGNCTITTGGTTNGTFFVPGYDPSYPVPYWHQRMEMATICILGSLSLIMIAARTIYRWKRLHRFRGDDRWMACAALFLIGYMVSQLGTNFYGGGLHQQNIDHQSWLKKHWQYSQGWTGYYIVTSLLKIAVCFTFLEILPYHLNELRYCVFGLVALNSMLGLALTFGWNFGCVPVASNFVWKVSASYCVNYDIFRWVWIGFSIPIDLVLVAVPLHFLRRSRLPKREKYILRLIFSANLLGTFACIAGIFGVWDDQITSAEDSFYHDTFFMMNNDIEIFMYTIGASLPAFSRYLISRVDASQPSHQADFASWARRAPDLLIPEMSSPGNTDNSAPRPDPRSGKCATEHKQVEDIAVSVTTCSK